jgi:ketosteroid isomerase-like protein
MQAATTGWTREAAASWARELYEGRVDHKDAAGFAAVFTDDATLRFGNAAPIVGRAAIEGAIAHFFTAMLSLRHEVRRVSCDGDTIFLEATVTYTRHDGGVVSVLAMTVFEMTDAEGRRLAQRCQAYVDLAPLFDAAPTTAG